MCSQLHDRSNSYRSILRINLIDTAEGYHDGRSEELVGKGIRHRREEVVVVTKVSGDRLRFEDVLRVAEESLKRLKIDMIDLNLVHWPNHDIQLRL